MPAYVPQSRHASTCSAVNQSCILHGFCKMNDAEQSNTTLPKFVALFGRFGSKNPRGSNSNAMSLCLVDFLAQFDQLATPGCCSGLCKGTGAVRSMVSLVLTPLTWQSYCVKCLAFTPKTPQPWTFTVHTGEIIWGGAWWSWRNQRWEATGLTLLNCW